MTEDMLESGGGKGASTEEKWRMQTWRDGYEPIWVGWVQVKGGEMEGSQGRRSEDRAFPAQVLTLM